MPIIYDELQRTFTLHTEHTTYQMQIDPYGTLLHLYYGARTEGTMDYLLTYRDRGFSGNPYAAGLDRTYSYDALPQEFPVQGSGDFRSTLLEVTDEAGVYGCHPLYAGHSIVKNKYNLPGFPAAYAEEDSAAESLSITLRDDRLELEVELLYCVMPEIDIITRAAIVRNTGNKSLAIHKAQTACLDFVHGDYDVTVFAGRHTMERVPERRPVASGNIVIESRRGVSSHQYNPFMILSEPSTTEDHGRCWSMMFVYSGGFKGEVSRDQYSQTRMQMGLSDEKFDYPLAAGESIVLPEVLMSYSSEGFARLSANQHECIRRHICRGEYRDAPRPLLINSWEAMYMDFDGEAILELARDAKELGMEMLVLDDGWFGNRDDDYRALGDWIANEEKLGGTLGSLIESVNELGLKFGLWMEPEMISEDSDLYREHPEWAMVVPEHAPNRSRHQLVLDLSRDDVAEEIYRRIAAVLDQGNIEYLKWDGNRSISDVYTHGEGSQGAVLYRYVRNLYGILEKLHRNYPDLLIEGCFGGGGRFDAGMLYYTPQIWCSDCTDAIERLAIQYGTSFGYPASSVGAHVSACPNDQTGRTVPMATRVAIAMAGTFGYELDPAKLSADERNAIHTQVKAFHRYSELVRTGHYYRLTDPTGRMQVGAHFERADEVAAWQFVASDGSESLLTAVVTTNHGNVAENYVCARGLDPNGRYRMEVVDALTSMPTDDMDALTERMHSGTALMDHGFPIPRVTAEYQCVTVRIYRV